MTRGLVLSLLLLAGCATTELERKEAAINSALAGAYVACTAALGDPRMTWEPGAREYCARITNRAPECPTASP